MRFFEKLFGSVSNSDEKNDYARATLEYATSPEINTSKAKAVMKAGVVGLQEPHISVTLHTSYTSKTYLLSAMQTPA